MLALGRHPSSNSRCGKMQRRVVRPHASPRHRPPCITTSHAPGIHHHVIRPHASPRHTPLCITGRASERIFTCSTGRCAGPPHLGHVGPVARDAVKRGPHAGHSQAARLLEHLHMHTRTQRRQHDSPGTSPRCTHTQARPSGWRPSTHTCSTQ